MTYLVRGVDAWPHSPHTKRATSVALGIFDGVHLGHQSLLAQAVQAARDEGLVSVAFTFDPHPARLFKPEYAPRLLEPLQARINRMSQHHIDAVVVQPFNHALAQTSATDFVRKILIGTLHVKHVVVGQDFVFGHKQGGNIQTLAALGKIHHFTLHAMEQVRVDGMVASSTKVRELIARGSITGAEQILGRRYRVYLRPEEGNTCNPPDATKDLVRTPLGEQHLAPGLYVGLAHPEVRPTGVLIYVGHQDADDDTSIVMRIKPLEKRDAMSISKAEQVDVVSRLHSMPLLAQSMESVDYFNDSDMQQAKDILLKL